MRQRDVVSFALPRAARIVYSLQLNPSSSDAVDHDELHVDFTVIHDLRSTVFVVLVLPMPGVRHLLRVGTGVIVPYCTLDGFIDDQGVNVTSQLAWRACA